jgi:putative endonuclease
MSFILKRSKKNIGSFGEEEAVNYLKNIGYYIVDRNFRTKFGEIDIIAKSPEGLLIFVEVKTLSNSKEILPEDHMTVKKLNSFKKSSEFYANQNINLSKNGFRLDLIAISLNLNSENKIRHYQNIF